MKSSKPPKPKKKKSKLLSQITQRVRDPQYSFVVNNSKHKIIKSSNFKQALDKVLSLHPAKSVRYNLKFYLKQEQMALSLTEARVEAAERSARTRKKVYIWVGESGDHFFSDVHMGKCTVAVYLNGSELKDERPTEPIIPATISQEKLEQRQQMGAKLTPVKQKEKAVPVKKAEKKKENKKVMETKVKKSAKKTVKKVAKKAAAAPTKKVEPVKVPAGAKEIGVHELAKEIRKGAVGFNFSGHRFTPAWLEKKPKTSTYFVTVKTVDGVKTFTQVKAK